MKTPWEFTELAGDDSRGMGYIADANGEDILHTGVMGFTKAENLELANVAAAAPDLLDALTNIVVDEEKRRKSLRTNSPAAQFSDARLAKARAAIDRANRK